MTYSPRQDQERMYEWVTPLLREHRVRCGGIQPSSEKERQWASEGPRAWREYESFGEVSA